MSLTHFPHVYSPLAVGNIELKNRLQYSPIVSNHADFGTGQVNQPLIKFVEGQAMTGAALVTIGSTPIDFDRGRDFYGCLSAVSDDDLGGLSNLAAAVHWHDCKLSAELTHAGQWADRRSLNGKKAFVPSVVPGYHTDEFYEEITRPDMLTIIDHWCEAAERCMKAGFDMVMVHMAHGNLLSSFLSPAFNHREDAYGGTPEKRWKYPLEVLEAVSSVTKGKVPIEIRITGNEHIKDGTELRERIAFLKEAQRYADMVIVSAGTLLFDRETMCYNMPGYYTDKMLNTPYSEAIKASIDIPVSVVGGINTLEEAEYIISSGKADIVAMAKGFMADEQFAVKGLRGQEKDIRPCMRCMYCLRGTGVGGALQGCAVNPRMGLESYYGELTPPLKKKKVLIAGGGPGGMEAAQILTQRGHEVILCEKQDRLGGALHEASALPLKEGFRRYLEYTVRKTNECGADIKLNTEVTTDLVREIAPDALIIAAGAKDIIPPIKGIDLPNVHRVSAVDNGRDTVGEEVVVCGAGLSGAECALSLAMQGKKVTLIDKIKEEDMCLEMIFFSRLLLIKKLKEFGVRIIGGLTVKEFSEAGVLAEKENGEVISLSANDAVIAFGLKPDKAMLERLSSVIPETYIIGNAKKVGVIGDATTQAYRVAMRL